MQGVSKNKEQTSGALKKIINVAFVQKTFSICLADYVSDEQNCNCGKGRDLEFRFDRCIFVQLITNTPRLYQLNKDMTIPRGT